MLTFKTFVKEDKNYKVGDKVVAIHPQERYKTLTGLTVHKIHSNDKVTLKHRDGSLKTYDAGDVSKNYTDLNPNPYRKPFTNEEVDLQEAADRRDTITVDIPFLIRLLEYAREDAKTDMSLHKVVERLINIRKKGVLTMADYKTVTQHIREGVELDEDGIAVPGPTNVTGPQSGTDPVSATAVKPKKKNNKTLFYIKRNLPNT